MTTSVEWCGLTLGAGHGEKTVSVEGWESLPPSRYDKVDRARGHGTHRSRVYADERIVTVTGTTYSATDRDRRLLDLQQRMTFGEDEEPLTITVAGRTLTASAQLLRCDPVIATGSWNVGLIKWVAQWRCPDPLRYGPARTTDPVKLPTSGSGLTYPLAYPLNYGPAGETGQLQLANAGTAPAPILFAVRGDLPGGTELSAAATGQRLTYARPIPGQQLVEIDTAAGTVLVEGTSSRRAALTSADWLHVPARDRKTGKAGELTVQFTSLSLVHGGTAQVTATTQDTYW